MGDFSVCHVNYVVALLGNPAVVGDEHEGLTVDFVDAAEQVHDVSACCGV